jgi:soluble lytic murein transglycosylase
MDSLAKKEWFWALKNLNKQDKLIAAAYAHEINQPFLGIVTVSKTKDWNQTDLRFPLKYQSLVKQSAQKHRIIPAWVYGIMRRESAFDPIIVSSANAKGLMQVLPATARGVARKLGIKSHRTSDLLIPKKNANIGAAYLSQMLKRFRGNYVKATASYNAGPHRIPRWAPDFNISAPRWIESIPFNETRNYVRAVMSYTTIYDHKLHYRNGKSARLSQRLQLVGPK